MTRKTYNEEEFRRVEVRISFKYRYKDVTKKTLRRYIEDALMCYGGSFDPGEFNEGGKELETADPLFYGIRSIKVGAFIDADEDVQLLLQANRSKNMGASKVPRSRGRRRSNSGRSLQTEG